MLSREEALVIGQEIHDSVVSLVAQIGTSADTHRLRALFYMAEDCMAYAFLNISFDVIMMTPVYDARDLCLAIRAELLSRGEYCREPAAWTFPDPRAYHIT